MNSKSDETARSAEGTCSRCMQRLGHASLRLKRCSRRHLFGLGALTVAVAVTFFVPQVANLWGQALLQDLNVQSVEYATYLCLVAWLYVPSLWAVVPWTAPRCFLTTGAGRALRRVGWIAALPAIGSSAWLNWLVDRLGKKTRASVAVVLLTYSVVFGVAWLRSGKLPGGSPYPLAGAFWQCSAVVALSICVWLAWARFCHESSQKKSGPRSGYPAWRAVGRVLSWLIVTGLVGELIWILAGPGWIDFSYRLYTIWALTHFSACLVVVSSLVDYAHVHTTWPVRQGMVVVLIIMAFVQGSVEINERNDKDNGSKADLAQPSDAWYAHALARLKKMNPGPVVIVAASGGGSRAAIFASLVLEHLAHERMSLPELMPKEPTSEKDASLSRCAAADMWSDHIFLISSVSGGSLGSAAFVYGGAEADESEQAEPRKRPERQELRNFTRKETLQLMDGYLEELVEITKQKLAEAPSDKTLARQRDGQEHAQKLCAEQLMSQGPGGPTLDLSWMLRSALVDDMCTDFMAPVLRGLYTPGPSRSDTLAWFWQNRFRWERIHLRPWSQGHAGSDPANQSFDPCLYPLVVFNATDVNRGSRLAIGFPALPADLFPNLHPGEQSKLPDGAPQSLSELDPQAQCDLSLSRAVLLSANFPWGFRVSQISDKAILGEHPPVQILDGGVVDNTGIDTVAYLIRALQVKAKAGPNTLACQILQELRRRGVIVIEIDSGAKPVSKKAPLTMPWVEEPLRALNNALYANAELIKRTHMAQVDNDLRYEHAAAAGAGEDKDTQVFLKGVAQQAPLATCWFRFQCNNVEDESAEVMTAWALGPEDKAVIHSQFLITMYQWTKFKTGLNGQFEEARGGIQEQKDTVEKFFREREVARRLDSLRKAENLIEEELGKFATLLTQKPSPDDVTKQRDEILRRMSDVEVQLRSAEQFVAGQKDVTTFVNSLNAERGRLERGRQLLKDAKQLDPKMVTDLIAGQKKNLPELSLAGQSVRDKLQQQWQQSARKVKDAKDATDKFQQEVMDRATESRQFYNSVKSKATAR